MAVTRAVSGHRCGERHPHARLTDAQVRSMRRLREQRGYSYALLAWKFGCGVSTARDISTYATRWSA